MYIYILTNFRNIHDKKLRYIKDNVYEVSKERYDEIVLNMSNKKLIREATEAEIDAYKLSGIINKYLIDNQTDDNKKSKKGSKKND